MTPIFSISFVNFVIYFQSVRLGSVLLRFLDLVLRPAAAGQKRAAPEAASEGLPCRKIVPCAMGLVRIGQL